MSTILSMTDIEKHSGSSSYYFWLFWYNNRLFRAPPPHCEDFEKILLANIPEIQSLTKTDFILENEWGQCPVYEHKIYEPQIKINQVTPVLAKEFISTICRINAKMIVHDLIVVDIHEGNIISTNDGIKWLDIGAFSQNNAYNSLRSFVGTGYFICKYVLQQFNNDHEHIGLENIQSFEILSAISDENFTKPESWHKLNDIVMAIPIVT